MIPIADSTLSPGLRRWPSSPPRAPCCRSVAAPTVGAPVRRCAVEAGAEPDSAKCPTSRAGPAAGRRGSHGHDRRPTSARSSPYRGATCRRSRPATSWRSRSAAGTTASCSTASSRGSSSRAATAVRPRPNVDPAASGPAGPATRSTDEPVTGEYGRGIVAMARTREPNSVGSQFFIVLDDEARGRPRERQHLPDHRQGRRPAWRPSMPSPRPPMRELPTDPSS